MTAGENRVARLCSQERIWSVFAKTPGLTRKAGPPVHDDLVDRKFTALRANQVWPITEHRTDEGELSSAPSRISTPTASLDTPSMRG
jgi:hypothetical protein